MLRTEGGSGSAWGAGGISRVTAWESHQERGALGRQLSTVWGLHRLWAGLHEGSGQNEAP